MEGLSGDRSEESDGPPAYEDVYDIRKEMREKLRGDDIV